MRSEYTPLNVHKMNATFAVAATVDLEPQFLGPQVAFILFKSLGSISKLMTSKDKVEI
jgi:hypothetical protein